MIEWFRFGLTALFLGAGVITLFISILGTFRLEYSLNRLHSSAITDTLVLMLFIIGCVIASGMNVISAKLIIVLFIQWCTSPLVSHMFVKTKVRTVSKHTLHCKLLNTTGTPDSANKEVE